MNNLPECQPKPGCVVPGNPSIEELLERHVARMLRKSSVIQMAGAVAVEATDIAPNEIDRTPLYTLAEMMANPSKFRIMELPDGSRNIRSENVFRAVHDVRVIR